MVNANNYFAIRSVVIFQILLSQSIRIEIND